MNEGTDSTHNVYRQQNADYGLVRRLRQRLCKHGRGRWIAAGVCVVCCKKLGETPDDRWRQP